MTVLTAHIVVHLALLSTSATNAQTYHNAYQQAESQRQPLLVLVGSESCLDSQTMRAVNMPALGREGGLQNIAYAYVDRDTHPEMGQQLTYGDALPQLVLFTQVSGHWQRHQMAGVVAPADVRAFIQLHITHAKELEAKAAAQPQWEAQPIRWSGSGST